MAWQTVLNWVNSNPEATLAIAQTGNTLLQHIKPDRRKELVDDVLNSQTQFRDRLARQAFGNFTAAERQQIQAAAEPQVNQVAANVARRGLGTSGAGAQIIAQAQQAPFLHAQQNAMGFLPVANTALLASSQMLGTDMVGPILGSLQKKLALLNEDRETNLTFTDIFNMLLGNQVATPTKQYSKPIGPQPAQGQGYQSPFLTGGLDASGLNSGFNSWLYGG